MRTQHSIEAPYLLVLFGVTLFVDTEGRRYTDRLWAKDLIEHLKYLRHLTLYCAREPLPAAHHDLVCLDDDSSFAVLRTVGLPRPRSMLHALLRLPKTIAVLWTELGRCAIVHSSVAGWPLPEAWFITPMVRFRRRPHVIVVESAFWRLPLNDPKSPLWRKAWARLQERGARYCLDRAQLAVFTHEGFRRSLLSNPVHGRVIEASWIDAECIVERQALTDQMARKLARSGLRLGFFGRLTPGKGVLDALSAIRQCQHQGIPVQLDVYGEGPLQAELERAAQELGPQTLRLHSPLPYAPSFFEQVADCDAVLIPTHSDEQPRIVFDAYSQGVPVVATRTEGHRSCVREHVTGKLFPAGDVAALIDVVRGILNDKAEWLHYGPACRDAAAGHTHKAMHAARLELLYPLLVQPGTSCR